MKVVYSITVEIPEEVAPVWDQFHADHYIAWFTETLGDEDILPEQITATAVIQK